MSAATTTTITDVVILAKKHRRRADVFDITLSSEGIDIKRPGKSQQHLSWDRISQWEIAEHAGFVVLTLRGDGAVTPLVVKGWTLDDLELVTNDPLVPELLAAAGAVMIGYAELREAMRAG